MEQHDVSSCLFQHLLRDAFSLQGIGLIHVVVAQVVPCRVRIQQFVAAAVDDVSLILDQLVVFPGSGMNVQHLAFGHALAVVHEVEDFLLLEQSIFVGLGLQFFPSSAHGDHVILNRDEVDAGAGVTLAASASA